MSHIQRHLTPANVNADNMTSGAEGEAFNITMGNMVAAHWLKLTDPRLVKIVRLEFATELKQGTQLVSLVPRIAKNVPALLNRIELDTDRMDEAIEDRINKINFGRFKPQKTYTSRMGWRMSQILVNIKIKNYIILMFPLFRVRLLGYQARICQMTVHPLFVMMCHPVMLHLYILFRLVVTT